MVISLLQQLIFGMLLCLLDDWVIIRELNALNVNVLGLIDIRPIAKDLSGIDWDSSPSICSNVAGTHIGKGRRNWRNQ